jgi:hypothetical protein
MGPMAPVRSPQCTSTSLSPRRHHLSVALPIEHVSRWGLLARCGTFAFLALFAVALAKFVAARPTVEARFPVRRPHPPGLHDLASMEYGPVVTASSCEPAGHHHPAFLVDRRPRPTLLEKWASDPADRHPWVEIRWGEPHDVAEVVVVQGAAFENARYLTRFLLSCLGDAPRSTARWVNDVTPAGREVMPCPGATGIRLEFFLDAQSDIVRVYEIEAWGR